NQHIGARTGLSRTPREVGSAARVAAWVPAGAVSAPRVGQSAKRCRSLGSGGANWLASSAAACLAFRLPAGMLAFPHSRVWPEPTAADRTRSLPGLWHGYASW